MRVNVEQTESGAAGRFIVFEGGDGAGKSTHVRLLVASLRAAGLRVLETRQPGGSPLGQQIRDLVLHGGDITPRAEALLFAADKAQHVEEVVRPALARGEIVVSDRYVDSSVAYQGAGRDLGADEVERVQEWAVAGLHPDLTVVIDLAPEEGRRRRGGEHDRMEREADDFHAAIRAHFLRVAAAAPGRYIVVDGMGDRAVIHANIVAAVGDRLGLTLEPVAKP